MKVKVLRAGKFNGYGHKSLGWHEPGAELDIPFGPYLASLVDDGYVQIVGTQAESDAERERAGLRYLLEEAGIDDDEVIDDLFNAGYDSYAALDCASYDELLSIPGVLEDDVDIIRNVVKLVVG